MEIKYPRILPTGDRALTVEFGNEINEQINAHLRVASTFPSLLAHAQPISNAN